MGAESVFTTGNYLRQPVDVVGPLGLMSWSQHSEKQPDENRNQGIGRIPTKRCDSHNKSRQRWNR